MSATPVKLDYASPRRREARFMLTRSASGGTILLASTPARSALALVGAIVFATTTAFCFFASIGQAISMLGSPDHDGPLISGLVLTGIASHFIMRKSARTLAPIVIRIDGAALYLLRPPWLTGKYQKWRREEIRLVHATGGQLRLGLQDGTEVVLLKGFREVEFPLLAQAADLVRDWLGVAA